MFNRRKFMAEIRKTMPNIDECSNKKYVLKVLKKIYIDEKKHKKSVDLNFPDCAWNRFVDKCSRIDIANASDEDIRGYIIYQLYSACESGNGWCEFFDITTSDLNFDAYEVLCELRKLKVSKGLNKLFCDAMKAYDFGISDEDTIEDIREKELERDSIIERKFDPILFKYSSEITTLAQEESTKY